MFEEFNFPYPKNLIMSYLGGSNAHGAAIEGKKDTDWYGVYVEPIEKVLGLDSYEHFVTTTGGGSGGNGPQDVDVCLYSLRKWAGLAAKGNPSCLHFLFAPKFLTTDWWKMIEENTDIFLSKKHMWAFLGFARNQMQRLLGERGQKNVNRAELEEKYGYDTKYAMHVIRLYGEAKELMETGRITLPRPNKAELIDIRKGKFALSEIKDWGAQLEAEAVASAERSPLPEKIDREAISELITEVQRDFWDPNWVEHV